MLSDPFLHEALPSRVLFGRGTVVRLPEELHRLRIQRALVLTDARQVHQGEQLRTLLGSAAVGLFGGARMHTPTDVTVEACRVAARLGCDGVVALGGGSTTGLAKAIALRTDLPQIILPTTYAGSEVTPILGETEAGRKVTQRTLRVLPETVVYDIDLTLDLPVPISVTSGLNAIAHAAEALYSPELSPVVAMLAEEGARALIEALPQIAAHPRDAAARGSALSGAWLCGVCLGMVGMALHHKLCHVLGGAFDLPHADTHSVVLPHALAYNLVGSTEARRRLARATGAEDPALAIHQFAQRLGAPTALRDIGMPESGIVEAARIAVSSPYQNPRPVDEAAIAALLRRAWAGEPPTAAASSTRRATISKATISNTAEPPARDFNENNLTEAVLARVGNAPDARVRQVSQALVRHLHGFIREIEPSEAEWRKGIEFLTETGQTCSATRQEFILLSDTLGVSMLVDAINHRLPGDATETTVLGPFYVEAEPFENGADISLHLTGVPLFIGGTVRGEDGQPIAGASVDVWHSDERGFYDLQKLDGLAGRGRFRTASDGSFHLWTVRPVAYPIPEDGPVGKMLAAQGRHPYRPEHVHFMIAAGGFRTLVTHLFAEGDAYLDSDVVFGVKGTLICNYQPHEAGLAPDGRAVQGHWLQLSHDFVLALTQ